MKPLNSQHKKAHWDFLHKGKYMGIDSDIHGREFYRQANKNSGTKVLDVGCSDLECMLGQETGSIVGVDVSRDALMKANQRIKRKGEKHKTDLVLASASNLPFKDDYFDKTICIETLSYLGPEYRKSLEEIERVSNNNVFLTFHHEDDAIKRGKKTKNNILLRFDGYELALFNENDVKNVLGEIGLDPKEMRTYDYESLNCKDMPPKTKCVMYVECEK